MGGEDAARPLARDLLPPAGGQLIRRVVGNRPWELAPAAGRRILKVVTMGGTALSVAGVAAFWFWMADHGMTYWWLFFGKGGWAIFAGAGAALARTATRLVGWQLRRVAGVELKLAALRGRREGSIARVVGTVHAPEAFEAGVSGRRAVLARYRHVLQDRPPWDETRGVDFLVEVEGGDRVRVAVHDAFLLDAPRPTARSPRSEVSIAAGDRVEVIGVLDREPDPAGVAPSGRGVPLREIMRGTDRIPLLVRRL